MRRILAIVSAAVIAVAGVATPANAAPVGVAALNCQHSQGSGSVVSAAHITGPWGDIGAVQLCRSGSYYWAYVVEYESVPRGAWAIAHLFRYSNGVKNGVWSCNSQGGNGYIEPGQTMCWTPRVYAPSASITFMATGHDCWGIFDACNPANDSYGQTARTR